MQWQNSGVVMQTKVLMQARKLVYGERAEAYGSAEAGYRTVCVMFQELTGIRLMPKHIAVIMILLKLQREEFAHKPDNLIDIAGYVEILAQIKGVDYEDC